ncbi:proteasome inhibitor PI31 subunit-like [Amphibalanus amphitrite]|uniref:proteasome inhibitor PI31 subunit-like n=1 Tax=Amphibalanus amphitrite TaxID=1232801 RepID=UPI001C910EE0|nr:proteasome inhibitor PI31 subunit-like [Amphibalanus amphitrite]XP_043213818.1 proteasome inhibitor PI31 subunit-like [Amphibalanus amphitrite]XP_043213819.1 proteasome inhibitor PI31 subunit-like [Amphibalanus amphitrite]XP_043213820.1 proteasome inhibitor PI31 subunit-like [Amphibalanus amphitrite]
MADPFFGLELVHVAHREALQRPADAAMLFVHWTLASSGLQAEHPAQGISNQSASSEVLPPGWSDQEGVYELSYVGRDRSRYLVKALVVEGQLITNMSKVDSDATSVFNKPISEMVSDDFKDFHSAYKDVKTLKDQITQELVEALAPGFRSLRVQDRSPRRGSSQERRMSEPAVDPLRVPGYGSDRHSHPLAVGGADLDPLGRGLGGGMLMDPRRPPVTNLPPGVPPGARFDPFGPPGLGPGPGGRPRPRHPGEPDPDHLRMPGSDYDNMFM